MYLLWSHYRSFQHTSWIHTVNECDILVKSISKALLHLKRYDFQKELYMNLNVWPNMKWVIRAGINCNQQNKVIVPYLKYEAI